MKEITYRFHHFLILSPLFGFASLSLGSTQLDAPFISPSFSAASPLDMCQLSVQSYYKQSAYYSPPKVQPKNCEYSYGSWSKCATINGSFTSTGRQFRIGKLVSDGDKSKTINGQLLSSSSTPSRNQIPPGGRQRCDDSHTQYRDCLLLNHGQLATVNDRDILNEESLLSSPSLAFSTTIAPPSVANYILTETAMSTCEYETASWSVCKDGKQISVQRLRSNMVSRGRSTGQKVGRCKLFRRVERYCPSATS